MKHRNGFVAGCLLLTASGFAARADKESWPASRFLATQAEHEIAERDRRDMSRLDGPLRSDGGAVVVDTTGVPIDAVVDTIVGMLDR